MAVKNEPLTAGGELEPLPRERNENGRKPVLRPLAPSTYLLRNAGKTIPLTGVIMLAILLVAGIISMIDSIPYSIRTIYSYSKEMLGVTPRGDPSLTPKIIEEIKRNSPVPLDRVMLCRASSSQVQSIVGKWPFVVLGLNQSDTLYYLKRQGSKRLIGRLPKPGAPEAIVSTPIAKNLGLRLDDPHGTKQQRDASVLLGPDKTDSYSPQYVKVVGIADTDRWLMVDSVEYQREHYLPPVDIALVFARNPADQDRLDHWADNRFKGQRAQIFAYFQIDKSTRDMFKTLYAILNIVIGTLVLVITFMMGMLMNIYQSQRLQEFGLLQAIGYTRKQLLRRVALESVAVVVLGWVLGVCLAFGMLNVVKTVLMDPKAYALDSLDPMAYRYTAPLPFAILIVALATVIIRFRRFDPVGIVERRLV